MTARRFFRRVGLVIVGLCPLLWVDVGAMKAWTEDWDK
jgi:hypothetical protein